MSKKKIILTIFTAVFAAVLTANSARAVVDNPDTGAPCDPNTGQICGNGEVPGGSGTAPSSVNISYSPSQGVAGQNYNLTIDSENINPNTYKAVCTDVYSDGSTQTSNYDLSASANTTKTWPGTIPGGLKSMHCDLSGTKSGQVYTDSATFTVLQPSCSASASWNPTSANYGASATLSWNINYQNLGNLPHQTVRDCGAAENAIDSGTWSPTVYSTTNCTVKGYINNSAAPSCTSPVAAVSVSAPPPATGSINITMPGGPNFNWVVAGTNYSKSGTGATTLSNVPGGSYALGITGGWNWNVFTGVTTPFGDVITLPTYNTGTSGGSGNNGGTPPAAPTCQDRTATNYGGSLPCTYPAPPQPGQGGLPGHPNPRVPDQKVFLKFDPLQLISGLFHKALAQNYISSITFTINYRPGQSNKGTFQIENINLSIHPSNSITVSGSASDSADGYKTLDLYKTFKRLSDNSTVSDSRVAPAWNGIVTDANGAWSTASNFQCDGKDGAPFYISDYQDISHVLYDQGDHTGDTSPSITLTKYCGESFVLQSVDDNGNPLPPAAWSAKGPYSTWDNSQSRVSKDAAGYYYSLRADQGAYNLSLTAPSGYVLKGVYFVSARTRVGLAPVQTAYAADIAVPGCSGPASGTTICPFALTTADGQVVIKAVWTTQGQQTNPGTGTCSPATQTVNIGVQAKLQVINGTGFASSYSWSAPEGNPPSGNGTSFSTTFSSVGTKTVTLTNNGVSNVCTVNVTAPPACNPTLVINPPNQSTTCSAQSIFTALYDPDGPSCPNPEQNVSASAVWASNNPSVAQSKGGGIFLGLKVGQSGISATYAGLNATGVLNVGSGPSCPVPDFSCSLNPSSISVNQGSSVQGTVNIVPTNGFNSPVMLTSQNLPPGSALSYSPNPAAVSSPSSYSFSAGQQTASGAYTVTVNGVSGAIQHACVLNVVVTQPVIPPSYSCTGSIPSGDAACPGAGTNLNQNTAYSAVGSASACSPAGTLNKCEYYPSQPGTGCTGPDCPGGGGSGGNSHYGCVSNTCAIINTPGSDTDGCNAGNLGAQCTVTQPPSPGSCTFTPSPSILYQKGQSSTLSWNTNCGISCSIRGDDGTQTGAISGTSLKVSPSKTTTYTLFCSGAAMGTATVKLSTLQEVNPGGTP